MPRHALHPDAPDLGDPDMVLHQTIEAVRSTVAGQDERVTAAAQETATRAVDERARRYWLPRIALSSAVSALLAVVVALVVLGPAISDLRADAGLRDQSIDELRDLVESSARAGQDANTELASRGLPTVPIANPGTAPDAEVIVDAATAQVLASLPEGQAVAPSADDLAEAVAGFFADNPPASPLGPTPAQVSTAVAAFLTDNPTPTGADGADGADGVNGRDGADGAPGDPGPPGPPPTAAEIQAALAAFLADNPNVLCPSGGTYVFVEGAVTLDGPTDFWACVVAPTIPDPPDPDPEGDTEGMDDGLLGFGG